jgi:uncharacterized protein (TIGR03000 family)
MTSDFSLKATLTWAAFLLLPLAAAAQLQLRPGMQGSSGLNSIPPVQSASPFPPTWGSEPSWYYIRRPPGFTGYYPGFQANPGELYYYRNPFWSSLIQEDVPRSALRATAPFSRPLPPLARDNRVAIEVRVPAGAEVWFDGTKTSQSGDVRHFVSPPLAAGHRYTYHIRARWTENGREVTRSRELAVVPGGSYLVDLTWDAGNEEAVSKPRP